ncbi:RNA polymerase sigma factor (sigma-70 family) [Thermosporothrix hazakensis]|jgi:RNA polymerase sigma factor (sigma-70 family)|uniref:RNA polymerase sigma factor (Sigma-70 family) n=1 Tax=Thermosporothrix hazakensis TaxID=644383 RepID=A0A326TR31_THEHA|nr:sigma-70 family RNA polymerase sigma factor [Thermosporothrix hazakensis]PZW18296.1 RNA polymerase sigma factor (sigma-70 family) [Thermosporothrix hazakensis]GCE49238.1 hypothetical protein KTH_41070 [Thermosporothrix hazakensis]
MDEISENIRERCKAVAIKAITRYTQELTTVDEVVTKMLEEYKHVGWDLAQATHKDLMRIAQRVCSRILYHACRSTDQRLCNLAFANVRRYLLQALHYTRYAQELEKLAGSQEDVLHQVMEILYRETLADGGPTDPTTFLKWTQVILLRQARAYLLQQVKEQQKDLLIPEANSSDTCIVDPEQQAVRNELYELLIRAIVSLRNQRYRLILLYSYIGGWSDQELAAILQASLQDVYLWRHRAIKALRNRPDIMEVLRSLRE